MVALKISSSQFPMVAVTTTMTTVGREMLCVSQTRSGTGSGLGSFSSSSSCSSSSSSCLYLWEPVTFVCSSSSCFCRCCPCVRAANHNNERRLRSVKCHQRQRQRQQWCVHVRPAKNRRFRRYPLVVNEIAGQYEESFKDVGKHLLNYFTERAVRTVLGQLYEMNPSQYTWFYQFCVDHKPKEGKRFLKLLVKEKQELGERVMITRLHLFKTWAKRYSHLDIHREIADQNLELLRERLVETVKWPSENDPDSEERS